MSSRFSKNYARDEIFDDLTPEQLLALAVESVKALDWQISSLGATGIIAYGSDSAFSFSDQHEIRVEITGHNVHFNSMNIGMELFDIRQKNKKNADRFFSKLKYLEENTGIESLDELVKGLPAPPAEGEDQPVAREKTRGGFLSVFIPSENFLITPILIDLNILVFILMVIGGAGFMVCDSQVLLKWGANFRPLTLDGGQWWRLFTSTFIHAGFLHLLMNMYALLYIGSLLEPRLGSIRYTAFYIMSGLLASLTSLAVHDVTISIGASGAIFGLYGVFLALLTTSLIEKKARSALLSSIGLFVAYNLLAGMKGGIDNAAHIGGLVAGAFFGYGALFSLREEEELDRDLKLLRNLVFSVCITILAIVIVFHTVDKKYLLFNERMNRFARYESVALGYSNFNFTPILSGTNDFQDSMINMSMANWKSCERILDSINHMDLQPEVKSRNNLIMKYVSLRKEALEITREGLHNGIVARDKLEEKNRLIEAQIEQIKGN
jgi:rhomboid protease GluP